MDPLLSVPITNYHEKHESSNYRLPDHRIHRLQNHRYDSVPSPRHDTHCTPCLGDFPLCFSSNVKCPPQTRVVLHIFLRWRSVLEDCETLGGGCSLEEGDHLDGSWGFIVCATCPVSSLRDHPYNVSSHFMILKQSRLCREGLDPFFENEPK